MHHTFLNVHFEYPFFSCTRYIHVCILYCTTFDLVEGITTNEGSFRHIVWTYHMRRMAVLVGQALKFNEPILLIGETGYVKAKCFGGKVLGKI